MRLLLDAHVSGRRVGRALRARGHDVLALDSDPALAALSDDEFFALAQAERRIVVTRDVKDFVPLLRGAAEAGRPHAGCILVLLRTNAYGETRVLDKLFREHSRERDWIDRVEFVHG